MRKIIITLFVLFNCYILNSCDKVQATLNVINGTGSGNYILGLEVQIKANAPQSGYKFYMWTGDTQSVKDLYNPLTKIQMSATSLTVEATYASINETYSITVINGNGSGSYALGDQVTIQARTNNIGNSRFVKWTGNDFVANNFSDPTNPIQTFRMPQEDLTIEAKFDPQLPDYEIIPGDSRDEGGEIIGGFGWDVRAIANHNKCDGIEPDYFISDLVMNVGALKITQGMPGKKHFEIYDFVSPYSGLYYKAMGFSELSDANPLISQTSGDIEPRDTTRFYWLTIKK